MYTFQIWNKTDSLTTLTGVVKTAAQIIAQHYIQTDDIIGIILNGDGALAALEQGRLHDDIETEADMLAYLEELTYNYNYPDGNPDEQTETPPAVTLESIDAKLDTVIAMLSGE